MPSATFTRGTDLTTAHEGVQLKMGETIMDMVVVICLMEVMWIEVMEASMGPPDVNALGGCGVIQSAY